MEANVLRKTFDDQQVEARQGKKDVWVKASDITPVLGIPNTSQALGHLADDEKKKFETEIRAGKSGTRRMKVWYVNEPGTYRLIFQGQSDRAERFKRWVTHDVLPAIRRTGQYSARGSKASDIPKRVVANYNGERIMHALTGDEVYTAIADVFQAVGFERRRLPSLTTGNFLSKNEVPVSSNGHESWHDEDGDKMWVDEIGLNEWMYRSSHKGTTEFIVDYSGTVKALRAEQQENVVDLPDTNDQPDMIGEETTGEEDTTQEDPGPSHEASIDEVRGLSYRPSFWGWDDDRIRQKVRDLVDGNLNNYGRIYERMEIRHGIDVDEDLPEGNGSYLKSMSPLQLRVALLEADEILL